MTPTVEVGSFEGSTSIRVPDGPDPPYDRGMLIWGTRAQSILLTMTRFVCGLCLKDAPHRFYERNTKFTFFFVPIFTSNRYYYIDCVGCGSTTLVNKDYALAAVAFEAERAEHNRIVRVYEALQDRHAG